MYCILRIGRNEAQKRSSRLYVFGEFKSGDRGEGQEDLELGFVMMRWDLDGMGGGTREERRGRGGCVGYGREEIV